MSATCAACGAALPPERYARCVACADFGRPSALCVACARGHLCTERCRTGGCVVGLCTKLVTSGVLAERFGVDAER